ncbi:MAG: ABC transporter permease [Rhodospirillales bacterium]
MSAPGNAPGKSGKFGFLPIYAIIYLIFIYAPILFLPLFSFNDSTFIAFPLQEFTFKWYVAAFESERLMEALMNSVKVAVPVAIVSTVFGTLAAKAVTAYRMPGKAPLISFIMTPLVVPGIIVGIALLVIANTVGLPLSLLTIGLAHLAPCTAFSLWIMISRLEGFDRSLEEASMSLGEGAWRTFWRVTFPLILPGIIASLLLTFTVSFDEFILAFFLAGREPTLPIYMWSQLRFPAQLPPVLALGSLILLFSFVLVYVAEWFRRRGTHAESSSGV